jgi:hypothetical protein
LGVEPVYDSFLELMIEKAGTLRAGVTFLRSGRRVIAGTSRCCACADGT